MTEVWHFVLLGPRPGQRKAWVARSSTTPSRLSLTHWRQRRAPGGVPSGITKKLTKARALAAVSRVRLSIVLSLSVVDGSMDHTAEPTPEPLSAMVRAMPSGIASSHLVRTMGLTCAMILCDQPRIPLCSCHREGSIAAAMALPVARLARACVMPGKTSSAWNASTTGPRGAAGTAGALMKSTWAAMPAVTTRARLRLCFAASRRCFELRERGAAPAGTAPPRPA